MTKQNKIDWKKVLKYIELRQNNIKSRIYLKQFSKIKKKTTLEKFEVKLKEKNLLRKYRTEVKRIENLRKERKVRKEINDKNFETKILEYKQNICKKYEEKLKECWSNKYKIGTSVWAGGNNNWRVDLLKADEEPCFELRKYKEWSSNGKWSGNSYTFYFDLPVGTEIIDDITEIKLMCPAGTYILQQGRGMEIKIKRITLNWNFGPGIAINENIIEDKIQNQKLQLNIQ